jgi:hypothetical protein
LPTVLAQGTVGVALYRWLAGRRPDNNTNPNPHPRQEWVGIAGGNYGPPHKGTKPCMHVNNNNNNNNNKIK